MIVTRFAPSPNGPLHLGHAYSAIIAHDLAKNAGGRFLLRIEDIDGARSRADLPEQFRRDLEWLGLEWEETPAQSTRIDRYQAAAEALRRASLLYPCRCSRAEIARASKAMGLDGPIYPGTCKESDVSLNAPVAWRLDMHKAMQQARQQTIRQTGPLIWHDALAGKQVARPELAGDVVLVRKDAATPASYHLAATLDDAADGVTLVTRGADLFGASHVHRLLQAVLGLPVPRWHHHALLHDETGRKLAKRRGSPSLADRREAGEDGRDLARLLRTDQVPYGISISQSPVGQS